MLFRSAALAGAAASAGAAAAWATGALAAGALPALAAAGWAAVDLDHGHNEQPLPVINKVVTAAAVMTLTDCMGRSRNVLTNRCASCAARGTQAYRTWAR